jgi:hypothetical protein
MATHVKVLAVLALVVGALSAIAALFSSVIFGGVAAAIGADPDPDKGIPLAIVGLTGVVITIYLAVSSLLAIICGMGLLKLRRWGRIMGIVYAAMSLINFPLGTILGVYALWVLFNKETEAMFARSPGQLS